MGEEAEGQQIKQGPATHSFIRECEKGDLAVAAAPAGTTGTGKVPLAWRLAFPQRQFAAFPRLAATAHPSRQLISSKLPCTSDTSRARSEPHLDLRPPLPRLSTRSPPPTTTTRRSPETADGCEPDLSPRRAAARHRSIDPSRSPSRRFLHKQPAAKHTPALPILAAAGVRCRVHLCSSAGGDETTEGEKKK